MTFQVKDRLCLLCLSDANVNTIVLDQDPMAYPVPAELGLPFLLHPPHMPQAVVEGFPALWNI